MARRNGSAIHAAIVVIGKQARARERERVPERETLSCKKSIRKEKKK